MLNFNSSSWHTLIWNFSIYHQRPHRWSFVVTLFGWVAAPKTSSQIPVLMWWSFHPHFYRTVKRPLWILQGKLKNNNQLKKLILAKINISSQGVSGITGVQSGFSQTRRNWQQVLSQLVNCGQWQPWSVVTQHGITQIFGSPKIALKAECTTYMLKLDIFRNPKFWAIHVGSSHLMAVTGCNELILANNSKTEFRSFSYNYNSKACWQKKVLPEQVVFKTF